MLRKTNIIIALFTLLGATGCEAEQPAVIPKNPAPPPTTQPRELEGATEKVPSNRQPAEKQG